MSELPFQEWFEGDFASDDFVQSLDWWDQQAWRCVLQKMWRHGGWLPADDYLCARILGCDVRVWRALLQRLLPGLRREVDALTGPIYRQKRIVDDWANAIDRKAKSKARTARATEERSAKAKARRSVTVSKSSDRNGDRNGGAGHDRNDGTPARAAPSPTTPTTKVVVGDGAPDPRSPAARSHANGALTAGDLAGPFVPARTNDWDRAPTPGPTGKTAFLQAFEEAGGDVAKMPKREGAPRLSAAEPAGPDPWAAVHAKFDPPKPKEEQRGSAGPDADEIDDFIKF